VAGLVGWPRRADGCAIMTAPAFDTDQLAPHSIDAENAVIGGVLLDAGTLAEVPTLEPGAFFLLRHQTIWTAIRSLETRGEPVDILPLENEIEQLGQISQVAGLGYLMGLVNTTPHALNIGAYGRIVESLAQRRRLVDASMAITRLAHSDETDIDNVMADADREWQAATRRRAARARVDWDQVAAEAMQDIETAATGERPDDRLRTYWDAWDTAYGGLQLGTYNLIGGRTGDGKTQTALNLASRAIHGGNRLLYISQEVTPKMLMHRMASLVARTSASDLIRPRAATPAQVEELRSAYATVSEWGRDGRWIGHWGRFSIDQVESMIIRAAYEFGTQIVVLDTVNKLRFETDQRYNGMTEASQRLEAVTKQTGVCTLALAQINREAGRNADGRPSLTTFKESGALEEDADNAWGVWWPWQHWSQEKRLQEPSEEFVAHILHLKAREGGRGPDVDVIWSPEQGMSLLTGQEQRFDLDELTGWRGAAK